MILATGMVTLLIIGNQPISHAGPAVSPEKPTDWSDRSYYLAMRDGTRLAVSLNFPIGWFPPSPPRSC